MSTEDDGTQHPKLIIGDDQQIMIQVDLDKISSFFTCTLCNGYFRDAFTIPECLHTFCKSCLIQRLRNVLECPQCKCKTTMHAPKLDRNIDSLFQKLFPQVQKHDEELEKQWYVDNKVPMPEKQRPGTGGGDTKVKKPQPTHATKDPKRARTTQEAAAAPSVRSSSTSTGPRQPPVKVKLTLQAEDPQVSLDKPYIEASGGIKVDIMRGYIADKLQVPKERVMLMCNDELLASDHTTEFIQRTKWKDPGMNMVWTFRLTQSST